MRHCRMRGWLSAAYISFTKSQAKKISPGYGAPNCRFGLQAAPFFLLWVNISQGIGNTFSNSNDYLIFDYFKLVL